MKRSTLASLLFCPAMIFFLTSCGDGGNDNKTTNDSTIADDSNTTATAVVPEPSTVIITPQAMMVATHKVSNFAKWKTSYDEHDSMRLANGIHSYVIGRGLQDSNIVFVALKVDDMAKAKAFAKDPGLKKAMQKGGVTGAPSFSFVTVTFQDTALIGTPLRARTTFSVKDWAAWQKSFEEGKQERIDNGISVRAIGHDEGDDKKVVLVTALTDTARAFAYYKSDQLKERRKAGGVITEPVRFLYRVVQRY
jgi:hypothetical protein